MTTKLARFSALTFALMLSHFAPYPVAARSLSPTSCLPRIQIAQVSGRIVVDYKYYAGKDFAGITPIKCVDTGKRNVYYFANECSFKMNDCHGYSIYQKPDKRAQVCYYSNKTPAALKDLPKQWLHSVKCPGAYVRLI